MTIQKLSIIAFQRHYSESGTLSWPCSAVCAICSYGVLSGIEILIRQ